MGMEIINVYNARQDVQRTSYSSYSMEASRLFRKMQQQARKKRKFYPKNDNKPVGLFREAMSVVKNLPYRTYLIENIVTL